MAATTLYYTPFKGKHIALFDGASTWNLVVTGEISIAVPATTSQMYDVFIFSNAGTATLELLAWTNDTTRATALVLQDGVLVKTGATTRRYIGSFRTTTVSGQTEDSATKRYLWNYYNRVRRVLQRFEATASWNYSTATVRQANGASANQVEIVLGVAESPLDLMLQVAFSNTGDTVGSAGIGEDATTTYAAGQAVRGNATGGLIAMQLVKIPTVGRHFYSWNEWADGASTTTWYGARAGAGSTITGGLTGGVDG